MAKDKKETTIDDLAVMVAKGFADLEQRINVRFDKLENKFETLAKRVVTIEKDITWIKEILESHTTILRDLSEEKTFIVHRIDRIEKEVELIKKNLKIA